MITRRSALGSIGGAAVARGQKQHLPNFLFIIADDHAGHVLGADGNKLARTPNLDRLAAEGTRFAGHYCNSPVCTPSRQSTLTGLLPHAAGVTRLPTSLDPTKPNLARQLKQVGYTTGVVGKMHFNRRSEDGLYGFDMVHAEDWIARNWNAQPHKPVPPEVPTKPRWRPFQDHARTWLNSEKLPYPRFYDDMRGTFIARQAAAYLKEHRDRPFALWVSFPDPHSPYDFSVDDRDVFQPGQFQAPPVGPEDAWQVPLIFRDLTPLEKQGIAASYYTSTWQLDRNVGEVLAALRGLRLEENTLVVYIGDNGYCLGEHGRFEKHCGYEPALRVPLIVRQPGKVRRRAVVRDLTEMVDVSATILDMLGAPPIPGQHGQSLRPYLEGRAMPRARDHVFSEYLENEEAFIRTNRWKFIFCSGSRERGDGYKTDRPTPGRYLRLYDLKNDPGEFVDVSSKHRDITARMQELMLARFRATHPDAKPEADLEYYLKPRDA